MFLRFAKDSLFYGLNGNDKEVLEKHSTSFRYSNEYQIHVSWLSQLSDSAKTFLILSEVDFKIDSAIETYHRNS